MPEPLVAVEVALPLPRSSTYTYVVSREVAERIRPGCRVLVPFGRGRAVGFVVGGPAPARETAPDGRAVREILEAPNEGPLLTPELLELTRWASDYYLCSWGEMIRAAVPAPGAVKLSVTLVLTQAGQRVAESLLPGAAGPRAVILRRLREGQEGRTRSSLMRAAGRGGAAEIEALIAGGLAREVQRHAGLKPFPPVDGPSGAGDAAELVVPLRTLTPDQQRCLQAIVSALDGQDRTPFLLHGVTGSGKTEVYLQAIARCLERGLGALLLVPEIGLTPLLARSLRERFGARAAVLHSALAEAERRREWGRALQGEARVVLGPRSALFAPVRPLGLVVVDEEQDASYKQQEAPRYNGRDLALVRARLEGAVAVLGTATPSLESWSHARSGRYRRLEMPSRIASRPLPAASVVDLREEFRQTGELRVLSRRLVEALKDRLARGEQSVVLINRRGYSLLLLCRACGKTVRCARCSVSLVRHRSDGALWCHTCGAKRRAPALCPECHSEHLQPLGSGTERVERHLREELPGARILRLDSDAARTRRSHEGILSEFDRGEHDVLVGTQMVAKGHDFPAVTLVGVLAADEALGLPDFRAAERTYHLLTQVAGRAGRGERPGEVIVQAFRPDHYALAAAVEHDEGRFYETESRLRRAFRYPPFTVLALVLARASQEQRALETARLAASSIRLRGEGRVQVAGPALAPVSRIRGEYRAHLLARAVSRRRLGAALKAMIEDMERRRLAHRLTVDVDPVSLL